MIRKILILFGLITLSVFGVMLVPRNDKRLFGNIVSGTDVQNIDSSNTLLSLLNVTTNIAEQTGAISFKTIAGDARPFLLKKFLERHKSPMAPYAEILVAEADKNGFDYRLTTAIAMCESNAGRRMPSKDSYNAFGISVYSGRNYGARFRDWEHAIVWVSDYIRVRYYNQGIVELTDIGQRWAPPSVEKGNSWANCVSTFMNKII